MKYDVPVTIFGHTFNIKGVEASNADDAAITATNAVKKSIKAGNATPSMPKAEFRQQNAKHIIWEEVFAKFFR